MSRELLDVLHVGTAMLFVAGIVGRSVSFGRAGTARDIGTVESLLDLSDWFERMLVIPAYFGLFATGLVTARVAGWPVIGAMRGDAPKWVLVSLLLFAAPMLVIP